MPSWWPAGTIGWWLTLAIILVIIFVLNLLHILTLHANLQVGF